MVGGKSVEKNNLVQERTLNAIADGKKAKGLYVSPSLADNIKQIFDFFPFSPEVVEGILVDHPEVLVHPARKILNLVTMVVELSDFTDVTQEEALMFVARSPEILSMDPVKVATRLVCMMEGFAGSSPNVGNDRCHLGVPHLLELGHDCISTDHHARSQTCWQTFDGTPRLL